LFLIVGVPIIGASNELIGVVTICDTKPRKISSDQRRVLQILASQILRLIEAGREGEKLDRQKRSSIRSSIA